VRFDTRFEMKLGALEVEAPDTNSFKKTWGKGPIYEVTYWEKETRMMHNFASWSIIGVKSQQIAEILSISLLVVCIIKNIIHVALRGTPGGHGLALREGVVGDRHAEVPSVHHHGQGGTAV